MDNTYPYSNNWFDSQNSRTGGAAVLTTSCMFLVLSGSPNFGTGAFTDDLVLLRQQNSPEKGLASKSESVLETEEQRTPAECLQHIRNVLAPAVSSLANALGVSRQAIYNWQNGELPKPELEEKLVDLARAADFIAKTPIEFNSIALRRKIHDRKDLLKIVRDGGSAHDAIQILAHRLLREQEQRERLTTRFKGRENAPTSADADFPAPNDLG